MVLPLLLALSCLIVSSHSFLVDPSLGTRTSISLPSPKPTSPTITHSQYLTSLIERVPFLENGYSTWKWRGHDINFIEMGEQSKPALLLIHGFGASAYHWRHNIPELAKDYHVYAFDMLGFGQSSKPVEDYSVDVWRDQALDFVSQVIAKPTTVAGNSLGGFTALYAAASEGAKSLIKGCILLNSAGRFRSQQINEPASHIRGVYNNLKTLEKVIVAAVKQGMKRHNENFIAFWTTETIQRAIIKFVFQYSRQSSTIEQVLKKAYFKTDHVDKELVKSISVPSEHPNAADVFYRLFQASREDHYGQSAPYVEDLLAKLQIPLLLCWGQKDPCMAPANADTIQSLYPRSTRVDIEAGHCPHDERPVEVNSAIRLFLRTHVHAHDSMRGNSCFNGWK